MATYDSIHTGEQVDNAVDIVLGNKSKGSATQPIYLDANGAAQNVNVDATPTDSSANLVQSGGVFTQLSTKYAKADISTDPNLGTSNTVIPSQGAVKSYVDTKLATKQDVVVAGDGIVKDGNTLSISTDNDFMTAGKLDNKWSHFVSGLDMGYGTETIEKMENAKHSTFVGYQVEGSTPGYLPDGVTPLDPKKFVKVGSPIITNDGIASGFSETSCIYESFDFSKVNQNLEIRGSFVYKNTNTRQHIYFIGTYNRLFIEDDGSIKAYFVNNAGNYYAVVNANPTTYNITDGTKVYYKTIIPKGSGYRQLYLSTDGQNYTFVGQQNLNNTYNFDNRNLYLGVTYSGTGFASALSTSIDLKDELILFDGVEVFSGNKTGVDTIKADDYEAPSGGSLPTITEDGIASGFSSSNYLTASISASPTQNIIIMSKSVFGADDNDRLFNFVNGTAQLKVQLYATNSNKHLECYLTSSGGTNKTLTNDKMIGTIQEGDIVETYIEISASQQILKLTINGTVYTKTLSVALDSTYLAFLSSIYIGKFSSGSGVCDGSIDLNAFKIYVDGNLVYQPCLKIPYTQTKDGKKIVDSIYRDRVEDEYGQAGFTPYYTLSDIDYTMATVKESAIVDSYDNGINKWTKLANLTCKQQGSCTFETAVTFTKPYIDTNYALSVPYSAKTKTGFTPSATGDWIANGKVNLNA